MASFSFGLIVNRDQHCHPVACKFRFLYLSNKKESILYTLGCALAETNDDIPYNSNMMSRVQIHAEYCLKGGLERVVKSVIDVCVKREKPVHLTDWIDHIIIIIVAAAGAVKVINLKLRLLGQLSFVCNLAKTEQSPSNNALSPTQRCSFIVALPLQSTCQFLCDTA
ncbi:hypothetical protein T01_1522 [Trichinella spiralis]|uniref:Uncharacterized protein n=1 Tax=Trichinella spiralis TaxID=6334 RepID=A0A0V1AYH1_TRISP|nr:hypothetical protein T01_1522 [Trichinella spiralis]